MNNAIYTVPVPVNEPVRSYAPGSPERAAIKKELDRQTTARPMKIPVVIGGKETFDGAKGQIRMPHDHAHILAEFTMAGTDELKQAVESALAAKEAWAAMPWEHRASIFLKAADLVAGPWRDRLNAATMLGQSKTVYQAEIDSACEFADFLRFNVHFAQEIYKNQPESVPTMWNRMEHRPLSGFVLAISPFNFTAIGGNLPAAPALMGNTVVWKPSSTAILSNYMIYQILQEAGLPDGVINFVPSRGADVDAAVVQDPRMAGFHFTGSTQVFSQVWRVIGDNISAYENYPRLVGETGGKDFIFAHPTAETRKLVVAMVRGAFEYQGQKCSAASRCYIPQSLWPAVKDELLDEVAKLKTGDVRDFTNFAGAVIDKNAFRSITSYIDYAHQSADAEVLCGHYDDSKGYFVYPTVIQTTDPNFKTMVEEIFGPVLTIYVYPDEELDDALTSCREASVYALTGAIFAQDRDAIIHMDIALADAAGNFYINDKPTGAVVGQQPFGGGRASGTNNKAGSTLNLLCWTSPRTIKETFLPSEVVEYPFMEEE
ncbi:MAG: L-glutamate gamma-semialdehyde dehydrogenase [Coriobacteriia bacterium]|nr:L-glutamate gamma-semialdehyde dehydrogenase [Coriobacteriia bacterium]